MRSEAEAQYFRQQSELESRLAAAQARLAELQDTGEGDSFFSGDPEAELSEPERAELSLLHDLRDLVLLELSPQPCPVALHHS